MEHYSKGHNSELELEVAVAGCGEGVNKLVAQAGARMKDLIAAALHTLRTEDQIMWIGVGPAAGKTISCVEIVKKRLPGLHQVSHVTHQIVEEYWEPKLVGLDTLKVCRHIPTIVILLSRLPLNPSVPGYQAPGSVGNGFLQQKKHKDKHNRNEQKNRASTNKKTNMPLRDSKIGRGRDLSNSSSKVTGDKKLSKKSTVLDD